MCLNFFDIIKPPTRTTVATDKRVAALASLFLSIIWVGSYQYSYNITAFNTYGINIWALSLWVVTGYITLQILFFVKSKISHPLLYLLITWAVYFAGLLLFEYIGYYILNIREQNAGHGDALIFGVIHGTATLHAYYLVFPILISGAYQGLCAARQRIRLQATETRAIIFENAYQSAPDA